MFRCVLYIGLKIYFTAEFQATRAHYTQLFTVLAAADDSAAVNHVSVCNCVLCMKTVNVYTM